MFLSTAIDRSGQFHAPTALLTGRFLRYLLQGRLSRRQSQSGHCDEENVLALLGIEPHLSSQELGIVNGI